MSSNLTDREYESYRTCSGLSTMVAVNLVSSGLGEIGIDDSTNSLQTIDYAHHEVHDGRHYNCRNFTQLPTSGDRLSFSITTPNGSRWNHFSWEIEGTTQTEIRKWEGATLSGGTAINCYNNNRNSTNTAETIIKLGTVISGAAPTSGTLLDAHSKGLTSATPSKGSLTGGASREDEVILKSGTTYLFEIRTAGVDNIIDYTFKWYEHTDKIKQW